VDTSLVVAILWLASLTGLFAAAVTDFQKRIIPDGLVFLTAGCGVAIRLLLEPSSAAPSAFIAFAILLILGFLARRSVIGGGDAKLIAAVTLLFAPADLGMLLLSIALAGGVLSGVYLLAHGLARKSVPAGSIGRVAVDASVPYGVAIFAGTTVIATIKAYQWMFAI